MQDKVLYYISIFSNVNRVKQKEREVCMAGVNIAFKKGLGLKKPLTGVSVQKFVRSYDGQSQMNIDTINGINPPGHICDILDEDGLGTFWHPVYKSQKKATEPKEPPFPLEILNKPAKLNDEEFKVMKNHTVFGYELIKEKENFSKAICVIISFILLFFCMRTGTVMWAEVFYLCYHVHARLSFMGQSKQGKRKDFIWY